jgi:hypothetical protein
MDRAALRHIPQMTTETTKVIQANTVAIEPVLPTTAPKERPLISGAAVAATVCCHTAASMLLATPHIGAAMRANSSHQSCRNKAEEAFPLGALRRGKEDMTKILNTLHARMTMLKPWLYVSGIEKAVGRRVIKTHFSEGEMALDLRS